MILLHTQRWLAQLGFEKKILLYATLLSLAPVLAYSLSAGPRAPVETIVAAPEMDTMIPKGFVLVPIEVQNYEALDSILGRFGIVDLFQATAPENARQKLVAKNVRILRAPQNPSHFAVLVAESEVDAILKTGGMFTVVVKRPGPAGTEFVKDQKTRRRKIVYGGD